MSGPTPRGDEDRVAPERRARDGAVAREPEPGRLTQAAPFFLGDRPGGGVEIRPRLHFHENDGAPARGDEVYLPARRELVPRQHAISPHDQPAEGDRFRAEPEAARAAPFGRATGHRHSASRGVSREFKSLVRAAASSTARA